MPPHETRAIHDMFHQIPGMAARQRPSGLAVMIIQQIFGRFRVVSDSLALAHAPQDFPELVFGLVLYLNLVANTAQKRLIDQIPRAQIGTENRDLVEGYL